MDDQDLTWTIEAYLNNTLPKEMRQELEQRMVTDNAFRQEVQLHRHLREHLNDPERWKHFSTLSEIRKESVLEEEITIHGSIARFAYRNWIWFGLLTLIVTFGFIYWLWINSISSQMPQKEIEHSLSPDIANPIPKDSNSNLPKPFAKQPEALPSHEKKQKIYPSKIAADFAVNEILERRIAGTRSLGLSILLVFPIKNADFPLGKEEKTTIPFKGYIEQISGNLMPTLSLYIFNNKDPRAYIQSTSIEISRVASGSLRFEHKLLLHSRRGLYYFILRNEKGEFLNGGKFTVGKD